MKTKNNLLIICSVFFLSNCSVHFDRPYSNTINTFPDEFIGKYIYIEQKDSTQDTILLNISRDSVKYSDNFFLQGGKLNENIKLAKGKKYYYLCQSDTVNNIEIWDIFPLKISDKKLRVYVIDEEYYKKYIKKHFQKIDNKEIDNFYKMDEQEFDKFCKSKLKKKYSLKFIKTE